MVRVNGNWVEFDFYRPSAGRVHLVGDFNEWRAGELPMTRGESGYWHAKMRLPDGEFKFRYCADGAWFTDFAAFGVEPGRFGLDSVLRVAPTPLRLATPAPQKQTAVAAA
jgi:1,4-alpha-glucan branching enzyme